MELLNRIPDEVIEYMRHQKGLDSSVLLLGMYCRANMPGGRDICLFADSSALYILDGTVGTQADGRAVKTCFNCMELSVVELNRDIKIHTEELVSGARLFACVDQESKLIAETCNTYKETLFKFGGYLERICYGEYRGVDENDVERCCSKCGRKLPLDGNICPACSDNGGVIRKFIPFFKRYMGSMIAVLSLMALISGLSVISPYVGNSFYIDEVLTEGGKFYRSILLVIAMLVSVKLADMLLSMINDLVSVRVSANITYDLKKTIFNSINRLSLGFFTSRRTGGLMTQIENDSQTLYDFFSFIIPNLIISVVKIVAMTVVMLMIDPLLALIAVATIPIYVLLLKRAFAKGKRLAIVHYVKSKALTSRLSDVLSGMRVVKAFAKESEESRRFNSLSKDKNQTNYERAMYNASVYPAISFVLYVASMAVWAVGGISVFKGEMSYGDLLTFTAYMGMLYAPLNFIVNNMRHMGDCAAAATRLFEIMDAIPDVVERKDPVYIEGLRGEVEFKNVSFAYTKAQKTIDKVSFKAEAGSTLGIVGRTGAGKSTIVNLLIRLYDATDGEICIDGVNVKDMSLKQLRESIAIVSQETYIFAGTVFENIAYAMPVASYEEVINAAIEAGAHDFIMKLENGYQTRIGFGYTSISGGERQRISIARALLRKPKILVLDEATAAMDTATEQKIENAINKLSGSCTTIMIAHRLSTLKGADKLVVIENGKLSEFGTHKELIENKGIYHKLYTLQLEALKNIIGADEAVEKKPKRPPMPPKH